MKAEEQERVQRRMQAWAKLTPEQRRQARENYKQIAKVPPDKRGNLREQWAEYQALPRARARSAQPRSRAERSERRERARPAAAPGSMGYEAILLFAVAFFAAWLFFFASGGRDATAGWPRYLLQLFIPAVFAAYFLWCWLRGGQTLAMKAWHIRLVDVTPRKALLRFAARGRCCFRCRSPGRCSTATGSSCTTASPARAWSAPEKRKKPGLARGPGFPVDSNSRLIVRERGPGEA